MKPKNSILNPRFRYSASFDTDLRRTFARIRREQKANVEEAKAKVQPIVREVKK